MKRYKSIVVFAWVICLAFSMVACGNKKTARKEENASTATQTTQKETKQDVTDEQDTLEEAMPEVDGDPIYIYAYDEQFAEVLQYFYDRYPEYKERVKLISANMDAESDAYQSYIRKALDIKKAKKKDDDMDNLEEVEDLYPSLIVNSSKMASIFVQNNYSTSISNIGIQDEELTQMYSYTMKKVNCFGGVKALTWYTSPGVFLYRTDIAQEVFGASDAATVQSKLSDWNSFREVAKQMKESGYKMLSGADELTYAILQQKNGSWIRQDKLHIDAQASICIGMSREFINEEYTNNTCITDVERAESFDSDVFGWFVDSETFRTGLETELHTGDFQICEGPGAYQWGCDYVSVSPNCRDNDLAALIVRTLCLDEDVLREMSKKNVLVNHQGIMSELVKENKTTEMLDQQNVMTIYAKVLEDIKIDTISPYDELFESWIQELSKQYNQKEIKTVDDVMEGFKDKVSDQYNYIFID